MQPLITIKFVLNQAVIIDEGKKSNDESTSLTIYRQFITWYRFKNTPCVTAIKLIGFTFSNCNDSN